MRYYSLLKIEQLVGLAIMGLLFILAAFRLYVGTDYEGYLRLYRIIIEGESILDFPIEPGFQLMILGINKIFGYERYFFVVGSFLIAFFIYNGLRRQTRQVYLGVILFILLYFYFSSLNITRQYISIAISFYSIRYIVEKRYGAYFIFVIIGASFHFTGLIMLLALPLLRAKISLFTITLYLIFSFALLFGFDEIKNIVSNVIQRYEIYTTNPEAGGATILLAITLLTLISLIIRLEQIEKFSAYSEIYINSLFISIPFLVLAYYDITFYRFSLYFLITLIGSIPLLLTAPKKNPTDYIFIISIFTLIILNFGNNVLSNVGGVFPFTINFDLSYS